MARFKFRLATLRRLREQHRDELRGRLAEAYEAERLLAEQRRGVHDETATLRDVQRQMVSAASPNVNQLLEAQRYGALLQSRDAALGKQMQQVAEEIERRRLAVVEADRQVKALDKLEDRQRAEFDAVQLQIQQKEMDEIAGQRRGAVEA
ncbi:MAG: hypothetical protein CMJ58_24145 [Planctomycetaceae bacterium]|nr:hypothetical protein [Planctomycetaceae bacterium]